MTDIADQREVRRLKLMKNAEARMNRLRFRDQQEDSQSQPMTLSQVSNNSEQEDITSMKNPESLSDDKDGVKYNETSTTSPYNLRQRNTKPSPKSALHESDSEQKSAAAPYNIVEDPEVPSLAEFLATQEATKTRTQNKNITYLPPKTLHGDKKRLSTEKHIEYIKISGIFVTALFSRLFITGNLGFDFFLLEIIFQSMFIPFLLFETSATYFLHKYTGGVSPAPQGSLLTTALMLCGLKADLIKVYLNIMSWVTTISNDLFLYIFAFITWHLLLG